jgi:hypothetical protein
MATEFQKLLVSGTFHLRNVFREFKSRRPDSKHTTARQILHGTLQCAKSMHSWCRRHLFRQLGLLASQTLDREIAAFNAIDRLERGEAIEYEVVPP